MKTSKEFAKAIAKKLEPEYPSLSNQIDAEIEKDKREILGDVVTIVTVSRLVWEVAKFIWLKNNQPPPSQSPLQLNENIIRAEALERFKDEKAFENTDKLLDVINIALEIAKNMF
jgi:hypothetical protein